MNICIIGSGISGLSTAYYLLKNKNNNVNVDLYEKKSHIGGHSCTIDYEESKTTYSIDIGFQVFNHKTYPNLMHLFEELNVEIVPTDMSFSVKDRSTLFEWGSKTIFSILYSLFSIKFWIILFNMFYFHTDAKKFIQNPDKELTIGQFCKKYKYHEYFSKYYLIPFCSAVWSAGEKDSEDLPAYNILNFMNNHSLLTFNTEQWYTMKNRSRDYVNKILEKLPKDRFNLINNKVTKISKKSITSNDGTNNISKSYDYIIVATNCHQVYNLLDVEFDIKQHFKDIKSSTSDVVIHKDSSIMPNNKNLWSSWNSVINEDGSKAICSYWVKSLQHINNDNIFVTLNPNKELNNVIKSFKLHHPLFNLETEKSLQEIKKKQGNDNIYFVGAYMHNGFHEDGVVSAIDVVNKLNDDIKKTQTKSAQTKSAQNKSAQNKLEINNEQLNMIDNFYFNLVKKFFNNIIKIGTLCIVYKGKYYKFGNGIGTPEYIYVNNKKFFSLLINKEDLGLAEAFIENYISVSNIYNILQLFINNTPKNNLTHSINPFAIFYRMTDIIKHRLKYNTIENSKNNIHEHYDLGNELYKRFLDNTMTYSCAYFNNLEPTSKNLEQAQKNKYNRIIKKLNIIDNTSVLEIGCGWGGFCQELISKCPNIKYTGITISQEQYNYCLSKFDTVTNTNIKFLLIDYRLVTDKFDYVVSIEMIEAVGHEFLDEYFSIINKKLNDNGQAMIQSITIPDTRYQSYRNNVDFIQKYIFPGGLCPSIGAITEFSKNNNLIIEDINNFGIDYYHTLIIWLENYNNNYSEIKQFGFDDRFSRIWEYYLMYCAVGFKNNLINLNQIKFKKY